MLSGRLAQLALGALVSVLIEVLTEWRGRTQS